MMPSPTEVPAPPPGPGVVTPFAAPPRDRDMRGLWIGLGIGGLVLVLCCIGGVLGGGFLLAGLEGVARSQLASVVDDYLTAMRAQDYDTARAQLCPEQQRTHTVAWYEDHYGGSEVTSFTVHEDEVDVNLLQVPATVKRRGQSESVMTFTMLQQTTRWVICGGVD
ncbi:hypothetical protein OHA72_16955 [Dactylosporangium sp. NBC_01737]|uniref:Rv0361 family membrane protein n=1 Tax=Dactylosporangium sp. NBC_01737 TaxID=2975959 RepID=UPI002E0E15B3|nr:hypothetical protein OHA72_16955 [Dactylosporangium sp. NBC_01737]